jgi:hypothetical protein
MPSNEEFGVGIGVGVGVGGVGVGHFFFFSDRINIRTLDLLQIYVQNT